MAEKMIVLMADLDRASQERMAGWYGELRQAGFTGTQTPGLPYHISLAVFAPEEEDAALALTRKAAAEFAPFPVHISHVGIFSPGRVLFGAPENNASLTALHDACEPKPDPEKPWTPHATVLIDEPETVCAAVPVLLRSFSPFVGTVDALHLCAFWPTREIARLELRGPAAVPPELS